jgi:hypothetical protein
MTKPLHLLALLLVASLATGCDGTDDRTAATPAGSAGADTLVSPPALPPGQTPGEAAERGLEGVGSTIVLEPVGGSGFAGDVTLLDRGGQVGMLVILTGTPGNTSHPGHIHRGSCASIGSVVEPLEPITTDATGSGSMTTDLAISRDALLDGGHVVVYHAAGGAPAACAGMPAVSR